MNNILYFKILSNFISNYIPNVISLFQPANTSLFPIRCSINLNVIDKAGPSIRCNKQYNVIND